MKSAIFFCVAIALLLLFTTSVLLAADVEDTIYYKLAFFHTKDLDPGCSFLKGPVEPDKATIAEFKWILGTLKNRCFESKNSIANTLMEAWHITKSWENQKISLLELARILTRVAGNRLLFGQSKVSFRATTNFWLSQNMPKSQKSLKK